MKHLFNASDFSGHGQGAVAALHEAHNELAAMKRSLHTALERESIWRRRVELLEAQLRRR